MYGATFENAYDEVILKLCIDCVISLLYVLIFAPLLKYSSRILGVSENVGLLIAFFVVFLGIFLFGRIRV